MTQEIHFILSRSLTFAAALALGPLALGPLALVACERDAPTTLVESPIVRVAGNEQTGFVGARLPLAFVVRVNDHRNRGVPNVPIDWRITSGAGELLSVGDGVRFTVTDDSGFAAVSLRPTALGPITVTASSATLPGAVATFLAVATSLPDVVIHIGPGFDCGDPSIFKGPDGRSDVTVRVGAVVEWVYEVPGPGDWPCVARVRSTTVPPGGASFDGIMHNWDRFEFVPQVEGTWVYVDANNGGRGTITARAP